MKLEHKSFATASVEAPEGTPGEISAVVAVFNNVDHGKDRIRPGFFAKALERKLPRGIWSHDWASPIAKTLEARELLPGDPTLPESIRHLGGLYIKGQFNLDTQRGREAYSDIKFGIIDEFSIGYRTTRAETDRKTGVRDLIEGQAFEWSPVLAGMNDQTQLLSVKGRRDGGSPIESLSIGQESDPASRPDFKAHSRDVASTLGTYADRAARRAEARVKEGRVLSTPNRHEIQSVRDAAATVVERLDMILDRTKPPAKSDATTPAEADGAPAPPPATQPDEAKSARVDPDVAAACFTRSMDARRLALLSEVAGR